MPELTDENRRRAEQSLGYEFRDPQILAEALTHASIADDRLRSNERMEFLGDAVLGMVVCEHLFHTFPDYLEGELTKVKSAVVSRKVCAEVSQELGLTQYLIVGKGMINREPLPSSLAAAVFESVVAAIYLDGGWEPVRKFILDRLIRVVDENAASAHQQNYKSALQQHAQKFMESLPTYRLIDEKGPDHSKCFQVAVDIGGRLFTSAWGMSKKQAEQTAALLALQELGLISSDESAPLPAPDAPSLDSPD
jgi:ribonuclease-3